MLVLFLIFAIGTIFHSTKWSAVCHELCHYAVAERLGFPGVCVMVYKCKKDRTYSFYGMPVNFTASSGSKGVVAEILCDIAKASRSQLVAILLAGTAYETAMTLLATIPLGILLASVARIPAFWSFSRLSLFAAICIWHHRYQAMTYSVP
jgi:hypothetical protein